MNSILFIETSNLNQSYSVIIRNKFTPLHFRHIFKKLILTDCEFDSMLWRVIMFIFVKFFILSVTNKSGHHYDY